MLTNVDNIGVSRPKKPKRGPRKPVAEPSPGTIGARVYQRLKYLELSQTRAAELAGVGEDAIRDMFRRPHQSPTLRTILALAPVLQVSPGWLAFEEEATPRNAELVAVTGEVAAGLFRVIGQSDEARFTPTHVPADPRYPAHLQFDVVVRGTSINTIAWDGDYLRCISIDAAGLPFNGDLVIVQRQNSDGAVEATAKLYRRRSNHIELWPASDDERWRDPIIVQRDREATDNMISVVAKVQFVHRPPEPRE